MVTSALLFAVGGGNHKWFKFNPPQIGTDSHLFVVHRRFTKFLFFFSNRELARGFWSDGVCVCVKHSSRMVKKLKPKVFLKVTYKKVFLTNLRGPWWYIYVIYVVWGLATLKLIEVGQNFFYSPHDGPPPY